jgi:hypothetical protein
LKNGNLLRQRKNPDRLCMRNTLRALDFFASLHLTIFEQAANFEFFNSQQDDCKITNLQAVKNGNLLKEEPCL